MEVSMNSSISGIKASFTRMDVAAHDVANVNTKGFSQSDVHQTETRPAGTRVSDVTRTPNSNPSLSGTDLATEAAEQITSKNANSANITAVKVQDRMIGELLDLFA